MCECPYCFVPDNVKMRGLFCTFSLCRCVKTFHVLIASLEKLEEVVISSFKNQTLISKSL